MNLAKGPARFALAAALLALMVGPMLFSASSALAQGAPANYYGAGLTEGAVVTASIEGGECASATVDADGGWAVSIGADNDCNPTAGATVAFAIDGDDAEQTMSYEAGGLPANVATGITLTVAAMPDTAPVDDTDDDGMDATAWMTTPWTTTHGRMDDDGMDDDGMDDDGMDDDGMDDDGMDDDGMTADAPVEPDTGNAGLVTSSGQGSAAIALVLSLLALAGIAGARTVTGRVS